MYCIWIIFFSFRDIFRFRLWGCSWKIWGVLGVPYISNVWKRFFFKLRSFYETYMRHQVRKDEGTKCSGRLQEVTFMVFRREGGFWWMFRFYWSLVLSFEALRSWLTTEWNICLVEKIHKAFSGKLSGCFRRCKVLYGGFFLVSRFVMTVESNQVLERSVVFDEKWTDYAAAMLCIHLSGGGGGRGYWSPRSVIRGHDRSRCSVTTERG